MISDWDRRVRSLTYRQLQTWLQEGRSRGCCAVTRLTEDLQVIGVVQRSHSLPTYHVDNEGNRLSGSMFSSGFGSTYSLRCPGQWLQV
ncbi:unnamed protein product [Ixodes persulcatus]